MTATIQIEIVSQGDRALAIATVRRLLEVLRAEFPGVTVVYPPEADETGEGGKYPPLYDMDRLRPFL